MGDWIYGIDLTYVVLVLPVVLLAILAQINVKSTYSKYSKQDLFCGMKAEEAARMILDSHGLSYVRIERIQGELTDNYDSKENVLHLSESTYGSSTPAAVGVAAHEAGHAVQYAEEYGPVKLRMAIIPVCNFGSKLAMPLFIVGLLLGSETLAYAGIIFFAVAMAFQAVTLPCEFDASRRAMRILTDSGKLTTDELNASRKVLKAAALTYVAAMATSLVQLIRLVLIARSSGGRNRR